MKLAKIYSVPKFKKLDKTGKAIFILSFLIPIIIIYTPLHLYYLPFGLDKDYNLESKEVSFLDKSFIYEVDGEELLDGALTIQVKPTIPKRNLMTYVEVEGENVFTQNQVILDEKINFEPAYEQEFEDFDYLLLDNYEVREDSEYLTFKIDYELHESKGYENRILLKYKNLTILQHTNSVELRITEKTPYSLNTYQVHYGFLPEELEDEISIYAIYKKPNESNGFIEILSNNKLSGRTIIPSQEKNAEFEVETIWHPNLENDISQKYISLKDEEYTRDFFLQHSIELNEILRLEKDLSQEKLHEFQKQIDIRETPEEEDEEFNYTDGKRIQNYYIKGFFKTFNEKIHKLSISYAYPIIQRKDSIEIYPQTPFTFTIVGENSKIEDIRINLYRKPLWDKL